MKNLLFLSFATVLLTAGYSYCQEPANSKKKQDIDFYRRSLRIDSAKAVEVAQVQNAYKSDMKRVADDNSLNESAKREQFKALIEGKNSKLRTILNAEQQALIIPSAESTTAAPVKKP